jgi:hypothetical protein
MDAYIYVRTYYFGLKHMEVNDDDGLVAGPKGGERARDHQVPLSFVFVIFCGAREEGRMGRVNDGCNMMR